MKIKISKNTLLLCGAVGLGVLCFVGANYYFSSYLSKAESRLAGSYQTRKVIVAREAIEAGAVLSAENLATRSIPARYVSSTVLGPDSFEMVDGQKIMVALQAGDPVDRAALERADHAAFSATVSAGERAITFPVDEISSMSGMLVPGDIIDLLYTGSGTTANSYNHPAAGSDRQVKELLHVRLILQAVPVMATGKTTQKRTVLTEDGGEREVNMDFSTVTLKVNPRQAEQILIAQKLGQLTAVLRNPDDKTVLSRVVLDEASFKSVEPAPPTVAASYVETIIGGSGAAGGMHLKMPDAGELAKAVVKEAAPALAQAQGPSAATDVHSRLGIQTLAVAPKPASVQPNKP